jgi:hypothetical protein
MNFNNKPRYENVKGITKDTLKAFYNKKFGANNNSANFEKFATWFGAKFRSRGTSKAYANAKTLGDFLNLSMSTFAGKKIGNNQNGGQTQAAFKVKAKTGYFIPWVLVKFTDTKKYKNLNINNGIKISGIKKEWNLSWNKSNMYFPSVRLVSTNSQPTTNSVVNVHIGSLCKPGSTHVSNYNNVCRGKHGYSMIMSNTNSSHFRILKRDMRGLPIGAIEKLMKRSFQIQSKSKKIPYEVFTKPKLVADLIELKRNGDWGQIAVCQRLNSNPNTKILEPFNDEFLKQVISRVTRQQSAEEFKRYLTNFITVNRGVSFYYTKACYYSLDRPACFACLLKGIPHMYRPRGNGSIYINFDRLITPDVTERTQAADILRQIIQGAKRGDYTRLAIMDTFHDFTAGTKKGNWSVPAASQGVTKLKRVMKEAAPQEEAFINLFNSITIKNEVEKLMGAYLIKYSHVECEYDKRNPTAAEEKAFTFLQQNNTYENTLRRANDTAKTRYCVIHDAGVLRVSNLSALRAMTQARIFDPATASLQNKIATRNVNNNTGIKELNNQNLPQNYKNNMFPNNALN